MNTAAGIILLLLLLVGCQQSQPRAIKPLREAPPPVVIEKQQQMTFEHPQTRRPAKEGNPPLVYLLESPAQVEVVDAQDGSVLANVALPGRSIISIDANNGVRAGQQQLAPGPLAAGHLYRIFVTTGTENTYRTGVIEPGRER